MPISVDGANKTSEIFADCTLLGVATLLPVAPFIRHLGFYLDDWGLLALFRGSSDRKFADFFRSFYSFPIFHMRPAEVFYKAALVRLLGTNRFGYHAVNALVFLCAIWLFYFAIRMALEDQRILALSIPLVFALLPDYSSDRFVPFTFHIGLSILLFFLNLWAMLKASQRTGLAWGWAIISVAALIVSGLAYEVALPLFALSLLGVWYLQRRKPAADRLSPLSLVFVLLSNAAALVAVLAFKALTTTRYHGGQPILTTTRHVARRAARLYLYQVGARLPIDALKCLQRYWNPTLCVLAVLLGVLVFWHLVRIQRGTEPAGPTSKISLALVGVGFLVFVAGNAIFLVSVGEINPAPTALGVENRTAIAASVGIAIIVVGLGALLSTIVGRHRRAFFSLVIALLCAGEFLVTSTIGSFWSAAADQQQAILASIQRDIPKLPAGDVLIVDGACPFIGPGIAFCDFWDMSGALQLLYRDWTVQGNVVSDWLEVHQRGILIRTYVVQEYPYGPKLMVYDLRSRRVRNLPDLAAAQAYFGHTGKVRTDCQGSSQWDGARIF